MRIHNDHWRHYLRKDFVVNKFVLCFQRFDHHSSYSQGYQLSDEFWVVIWKMQKIYEKLNDFDLNFGAMLISIVGVNDHNETDIV